MAAKTIKHNNAEENRSPIKAMMLGVGMGYILTFIVFIIYCILITYTGITEKNIQVVVLCTVVMSVLIAGFKTARAADTKGWLWGICSGVIYVLIMIIIGYCFTQDYAIGSKTGMLLILSIAGGGLGGVVGINKKR